MDGFQKESPFQDSIFRFHVGFRGDLGFHLKAGTFQVGHVGWTTKS